MQQRDRSDGSKIRPLHDDEDLDRWKNASPREKGEALRGLLRFVDKVGRYPPKHERFPGFPRSAWLRPPEHEPEREPERE